MRAGMIEAVEEKADEADEARCLQDDRVHVVCASLSHASVVVQAAVLLITGISTGYSFPRAQTTGLTTTHFRVESLR